jgi:hypothetical protein
VLSAAAVLEAAGLGVLVVAAMVILAGAAAYLVTVGRPAVAEATSASEG